MNRDLSDVKFGEAFDDVEPPPPVESPVVAPRPRPVRKTTTKKTRPPKINKTKPPRMLNFGKVIGMDKTWLIMLAVAGWTTVEACRQLANAQELEGLVRTMQKSYGEKLLAFAVVAFFFSFSLRLLAEIEFNSRK